MKFHKRSWQWVRLATIALSCMVIGNSICTVVLYAVGKPELTAWTGHVSESTPGALNDLFLGILILLFGIYFLRHD